MSPLLVLAVFFCCGIMAMTLLSVAFVPLFVCTAVFLLLFGRRCPAGGAFLLGCCCVACCSFPPLSGVERVVSGKTVLATGIVAEPPELQGTGQRLLLSLEKMAVEGRESDCRGRLLVVIVRGQVDCGRGDRVAVYGEILDCAHAFPAHGYVRYLANHGIRRMMRCRPWEISPMRLRARLSLLRSLDGVKGTLLRSLEARLSPQSSAIMKAMLLGDKSGVSPLIRKAMVDSGTIHILVVSGFNVGVVTFMVCLLLKLLRIPPRARVLFLLPCIGMYCLLTGGSEPVSRAGIMSAVVVCACLKGRDADIQNALALAMWLMLLGNPRLLFDASFQLSFASVYSLVIVFPAVSRRLSLDRIRHCLARRFCEALTVSACAWMGTAGFVAWYFRIVSPAAILVNLIAAPLAGFITLCGFTMLLAERIAPFFAGSIALTIDYAVCLLVNIVSAPVPVIAF